ncbi:aminoglycoside phosphotransferase family protein [Kaarinaea lacus]
MNYSPTTNFVDVVKASLYAQLGADLIEYRLVKKGGNSSVYRLACENNGKYALKNYPPLTVDPRNRLKVEFNALQFLHDLGETQVPAPILELDGFNAGVYEWIDGEALQTYESRDIDLALRFLQRLHELRHRPDAGQLPCASEACLSYHEAKQQLSTRWHRLHAQAQCSPALKSFLEERYKPTEQKIMAYLEKSWLPHAGEFVTAMPKEKLTLSPSDFGFHNAIKRPDGDLVFVDFEYFGWDDPAKLIADFLWHPGMKLAGELKQQFVNGALGIYGDKELAARLNIVYPLCGLRWCMIILNEFLPDGRAKRQHSGKLSENRENQILVEQLHKADQTLLQILDSYRQFPYAH